MNTLCCLLRFSQTCDNLRQDVQGLLNANSCLSCTSPGYSKHASHHGYSKYLVNALALFCRQYPCSCIDSIPVHV